MQSARGWLLVLWSGLVTGCGLVRLYPPVAFVEPVAPIYPDPRPKNCHLPLLSAPPAEPHEVFARIVSYAGSATMAEKMQSLIQSNACEIGADAVVLLPLQERDQVSTVNPYPDWARARGLGPERPLTQWVDRRYTVSQLGLALVFTRQPTSGRDQPGS